MYHPTILTTTVKLLIKESLAKVTKMIDEVCNSVPRLTSDLISLKQTKLILLTLQKEPFSEITEVLTELIVVIIPQYIHVPNSYVVHLKLIQCCASVTSP